MEWKPYRPAPRDPLLKKIDEWHHRQNGGYIDETAHLRDPDHPAHHLMPERTFTREDIRAMFRAFTGREPAETIEEWRAQIEARGGTVPDYAKHMFPDLADQPDEMADDEKPDQPDEKPDPDQPSSR